MIGAVLCLCLFLLSSCVAVSPPHSAVSDGAPFSPYPVLDGKHWAFSLVEQGYAVESFDSQAVPAVEMGLADFWYPHYLATVIIAADRDRTDAKISGWADLAKIDERVGMAAKPPHLQLIMGAMAYGIDGPSLELKDVSDLLSTLQKDKRLIQNSLEPPIIICFDYQAAALVQNGHNLEIIVPEEGTLSFEKGLLSKDKLGTLEAMDTQLLSSGFRLLDGRAEGVLATVDYGQAAVLTDYYELNHILQDAERIFSRRVMSARLYSSADAREHQFFALVYMVLVIVWTASVMRRTLAKDMRRVVFFAGTVLLLWMTVRLLKYQIIKETVANRYLWYSYYVFQLTLPLLLLGLAWAIDKFDTQPRIPLWMRFVTSWNVLMMLLVLTNDLHLQVFELDFSKLEWATQYRYGRIFYLVTAAWVLEMIAAVVLLMIKSRKTPRKRAFIFPLALCGLLFLYTIGYTTRVPVARESDYTMVVGLFVLMFMEVCMQTGLIPVNSKYARLFSHSPLKMQIYDHEGVPSLLSTSAVPIGYDLLEQVVRAYPYPVEQGRDTLLFATEITGGYALWEEDVSGLNRLNRQIETSVKKLEKANAMLAEKVEIRRAIDADLAKRYLTAQLESEIEAHIARLSSMIETLGMTEDSSYEAAGVAILLGYVKRKSNLFFRGQESDSLPTDEWSIYVDELAEIADYAGIRILVSNTMKEPLPVRAASLFYDLFYASIDWAIRTDSDVMLAHFSDEGERLTMRLLPSKDARYFDLADVLKEAIDASGGRFSIRDLDDATGISLSFPKEVVGHA